MSEPGESVHDNVDCFVGSANAKLDEDLKRASSVDSSEFSNSFDEQHLQQNDNHEPSVSSSNSYVLDVGRLANFMQLGQGVALHDNASPFLDFKLVKISCKKEYEPPEKSQRWNKITELVSLTWVFRLIVFLIVGVFIAFTIFQIVDYKQRVPDELSIIQQADEFDDDDSFSFFTRNASTFSKLRTRNIGHGDGPLKYERDWSGEETPVIYEIDPITFMDSNMDGFGDLNGIALKLDYIQNVLKINCIQLRNLNWYFDVNLNMFNIYELSMIDEKIGSFSELEHLISLATRRAMKVILEIDLTGTSRSHQYKDFYVPSHQKITNDSSHSPHVFDVNAFAYLNYDNQTLQNRVIDVLGSWCSIKPAAVYIKNVASMQYKNQSLFTEFLDSMRQMCRVKSRMSTKLIADFNPGRVENHFAFDLLRVRLDVNTLTADISGSVDPFESYLSQEKNLIWSVEDSSSISRELHSTGQNSALLGYYFILYSLPGIVLLKQGDELEHNRVKPGRLNPYRWDDSLPNSGFSNTSNPIQWVTKFAEHSSTLINDTSVDSRLAVANPRSFLHFQAAFNLRVKPKLNDDLATMKRERATRPKIIIPIVPEPFKNSYNAVSSLYLSKSDVYDIGVSHAVLKIRRKIKNGQAHSFYTIRFYRNVVFLVNLSGRSVPIDGLISATGSVQMLTGPVHVIFDSCRTFPDYIQLNTPNHQAFYELKPDCFVSLEY